MPHALIFLMTISAYVSVYIKMGASMLMWYNWKKKVQLVNNSKFKKQWEQWSFQICKILVFSGYLGIGS